jgi:hypothetical protein
MKPKWKFIDDTDNLLLKIARRSVNYVTETRLFSPTVNMVVWAGELKDGEYFKIVITSGVLLVAVDPHEMFLDFYLTAVASMEYDSIEKDSTNQFSLATLMEYIFNPFDVITRMKEMTFNDIMELLLWKFSSPTVEVYHIENPFSSNRYDSTKLYFFK